MILGFVLGVFLFSHYISHHLAMIFVIFSGCLKQIQGYVELK